MYYFGRWGRQVKGKLERLPGDDWWKPALELFEAQRDDLFAGREPVQAGKGKALALRDLCNHFLTSKQRKLEAGELTQQTFTRHRAITDRLIDEFGKNRTVESLVAADFSQLRATLAKRFGPVRLGTEVVNLRSVFKFGYDNGLIKTPVRFGSEFKKPSASVMRKHRATNGKKLLTAEECQTLLEAADLRLRAMILLGLNCGFGNHDCATLPLDALDLDGGWVDFPRPKTGVERRCPLWAETIVALQEWLKVRPEPNPGCEGSAFLAARGGPLIYSGIALPVAIYMSDLMKRCGVHRKGLGFYTLRHTFRTVADGSKDQVACMAIMGHIDGSISGTYRESIEDSRLKAVVDHVHGWLFAEGGAE